MKREFNFREGVISDIRFGKYPGSRSTEELIKRGIVVLDKPKGPTSHQVTGWLKDILNIKKAGHTGTLDPKVTGVLVVALEKSTKAMPVLNKLDKEYISVFVLHENIPEEDVQRALEKFRGSIKQTPPKKSAVKRRQRTRTINELKLIEKNGKDMLLRINCEAGTYIRKLAHDLGKELGCGCHMKELRRTAVGPFTEDNAVKLQTIKDDYVFFREEKNEDIKKDILPVEVAADVSKCIVAKDTAIESICNGADLGVGGVSAVEKNIEKGDKLTILSGKGELVAIGKTDMDSEDIYKREDGKAASLINVVMSRGTYPKGWN